MLGLDVIDGIAGSGFEAGNLFEDLVGEADVVIGRGGSGRIDFVLSERTRPISFGGDEGGAFD